jgi:hypothetical protein
MTETTKSLEGRKLARAREWALGRAGTGAEQIGILFALTEPYAGRTVMWWGYFTEDTLEHTIKALRACGWEGDDLTKLDTLGANEVSLVIEQEPDREGELRDRVRWVNKPATLALKERLSADEQVTLAKRIKAKIAGVRAERAAAGDDEIPF